MSMAREYEETNNQLDQADSLRLQLLELVHPEEALILQEQLTHPSTVDTHMRVRMNILGRLTTSLQAGELGDLSLLDVYHKEHELDTLDADQVPQAIHDFVAHQKTGRNPRTRF